MMNTTQPTGQNPQSKYTIPPAVLEKYPELVDMIIKTESMSDEEREYWFQILPIMTQEQVDRLKKILEEEAAQLAKLNQDYQSELGKINDKHTQEWDAFEKDAERKKRQEAEAAAEVQEKAEEESILGQLDQL